MSKTYKTRPRNPTTNEIERRLRNNKMRNTNQLSPYLSCRFRPFEHKAMGDSRIPDGRFRNSIQLDYKAKYDLSFSGDTIFVIEPCLPHPVKACSFSSLVSNGTAISSGTMLTLSTLGIGLPLQAPTGVKTELFYLVNNPYNATSARINTVGWKLQYTGKASDCQGYIQVDEIPIKTELVTMPPENMTTGQPFGLNAYTNTGTLINPSTSTPPKLIVSDYSTYNFSSRSGFSTKDTLIFRPENGAHGILRRLDKEFLRSNYYENAALMVDDTSIQNAPVIINVATSGLGEPVVANGCYGVNVLDDGFSTTQIKISTNGATANYTLELLFCIEYEITPISTFKPFSKPSPALNEAVLNASKITDRNMPTALPNDVNVPVSTPSTSSSQNTSVKQTVTDVATNVATNVASSVAGSVLNKFASVQHLPPVKSTIKSSTPQAGSVHARKP